MAYSEEIKDFALDLFLQYKPDGGHKYSLQAIADEILRKFNEPITKPTIKAWADDSQWDLLFQSGLNQGVEEAVNEAKHKDESIRDAKAREGKQLYTQNKTKNDLTGYLVIQILKHYAEQLRDEKINIGDIPFNIRDLEGVNRSAFENMLKMDGGKQSDKIDELFERIDAMG